MDAAFLLPLLSLAMLLAVCVIALASTARVERMRRDPTTPAATLAKDGPQGGGTFGNR